MLVLMVFVVKVLTLHIDCICIAHVSVDHTFRLFVHVVHTRLAFTRLVYTHIDRTTIARVAGMCPARTHIVS